MGEHASLSAMVGLVRNHVSQHLDAGFPRTCPAVAKESLDASAGSESFFQHLRAETGALGQGFFCLRESAVSAVSCGGSLR